MSLSRQPTRSSRSPPGPNPSLYLAGSDDHHLEINPCRSPLPVPVGKIQACRVSGFRSRSMGRSGTISQDPQWTACRRPG